MKFEYPTIKNEQEYQAYSNMLAKQAEFFNQLRRMKLLTNEMAEMLTQQMEELQHILEVFELLNPSHFA